MTRMHIPALRQALCGLALMAAAVAWAQVSPAPSSTSGRATRIQPMSTETQTTAFFYQQPTVLDREKHKGLRIKPADMGFAAKNQAVPLLASEFPEACLEYPIVFAKGNDGAWMALALTGLQVNANAFVNKDGLWSARYVPASVRRYPFILAEAGQGQDPKDDTLTLAADLAAPHFAKDGQPLFDDKGEPTELVRNILAYLGDFQAQAKLTSTLAQKLEEAGLLTQQNLQVRLGEDRSAVVEGVWIVDEAKLRQLADDKILAWFKGGEMAAVHAQMLSLRNLVPLLERSQPMAAAASGTSAPKKAASKAKDGAAKSKSSS